MRRRRLRRQPQMNENLHVFITVNLSRVRFIIIEIPNHFKEMLHTHSHTHTHSRARSHAYTAENIF